MRRSLRLFMVGALMLMPLSPAMALCPPSDEELEPIDPGPDFVPGQYIVKVEGDVLPQTILSRYKIQALFVYQSVLNGFAANLSTSQVDALQEDPDVVYIQQDQYYHANAVKTMDSNGDPWGLDRIDQRSLPLTGQYFYYPNGSGVHAYVIDTGVSPGHPDFGGRASSAFNAFAGAPLPTGSPDDCHGHGTHVGGIIGGNIHGVGSGVDLVGVKVLNCGGQGTGATVIAGVNWVAANAIKPAVANMSLGGGFDQAVNDAVADLVDSGVFTTVAAGNSCANACDYSPASTPQAYTVAASDKLDNYAAAFSNLGPCVDTYAPGVDIKSAWGTSSTSIHSGTSMAAPHVAGAVANFLEMNGDVPIPTIEAWLDRNATPNVIQNNPPNTINQLLYSYKKDVTIRDTLVDTGLEPDPANAGAYMWLSPDMWIRHTADGVHNHQNPEYGQTNYIYVTTRNRGWINADGALKVYAAPASSGLTWPVDWSLVGTITVGQIAPQTAQDLALPWNPPATGHYCLLARWVSFEDLMSWPESADVNYNTIMDNNIAWRNLNVVDLIMAPKQNVSYIVHNVKPTSEMITLSFEEDNTAEGDPLIDLVDITVDLGEDLYTRWLDGGSIGEGIEQVGATTFLLTDPAGAWFGDIQFEADEEQAVKIGFVAMSSGHEDETPRRLHAVQYALDSELPVGGVSYDIQLP